MGFFEKPMYDFPLVIIRDHSSKLLIFVENRIFVYSFWRQTDGQTDGQHRCVKPPSLRERRLNNETTY